MESTPDRSLLGLSLKSERQLSTTNAIENLIGSLRRIAGRVKRWRGARMITRWTVAAIADAATRFRCVMGTRDGMAQLVRALKDHENALACRDGHALARRTEAVAGVAATGRAWSGPSWLNRRTRSTSRAFEHAVPHDGRNAGTPIPFPFGTYWLRRFMAVPVAPQILN